MMEMAESSIRPVMTADWNWLQLPSLMLLQLQTMLSFSVQFTSCCTNGMTNSVIFIFPKHTNIHPSLSYRERLDSWLKTGMCWFQPPNHLSSSNLLKQYAFHTQHSHVQNQSALYQPKYHLNPLSKLRLNRKISSLTLITLLKEVSILHTVAHE